jgi:dienelactone hydrolase
MRLTAAILCALATALVLFAQPPAQDARNTQTPGTDTHFALRTYATRAEWEKRKAQLRRQILSAAGMFPMPERTPLHAQIFGRVENRDCTIEKVLLETMPGYYLGGNLYRPLHAAGKHPAVLNPHGHWTYGRLENEPLDSGPSFGISLARQGFVVFAWDMVGYNDTVQTPHAFGGPAEQLWSFGPFGLQFWNASRALDFVASLDDVDSARIAMAGASGGGTQTMMLAAVDDRLQFAAPVNMVSAIMQGGDVCENTPGLRIGTNNVEVASMFAPKPMLLVSATGDWTRNTPKEEFPAIRAIYDLYGKGSDVETMQLDAPHNFNQPNREAVYRFFGQRILGEAAGKKFTENNPHLEMLQDMLALSGRTLPANALTYAQIFEQWKRMAEAQRDSGAPETLREALRLALAAEWPEKVESRRDGEGRDSQGRDGQGMLLSRPGAGDRVPGVWFEGRGAPALIVDPDGAAAARQTAAFREIRAAGRPVLFIDAFQTGTAVAPRDRGVRNFLTFNASDDQCRVQDILTALAYLHRDHPESIELIGMKKAGIWAQFAAAVAPVSVKLRREGTVFSGSDDDFIRDFPVPGIQRAGGLRAAERLTAGR